MLFRKKMYIFTVHLDIKYQSIIYRKHTKYLKSTLQNVVCIKACISIVLKKSFNMKEISN